MDKKAKSSLRSIGKILIIVMVFILGGTGLGILFNAQGNQVSIIGGFALIGIAVAIIYKLLEDG